MRHRAENGGDGLAGWMSPPTTSCRTDSKMRVEKAVLGLLHPEQGPFHEENERLLRRPVHRLQRRARQVAAPGRAVLRRGERGWRGEVQPHLRAVGGGEAGRPHVADGVAGSGPPPAAPRRRKTRRRAADTPTAANTYTESEDRRFANVYVSAPAEYTGQVLKHELLQRPAAHGPTCRRATLLMSTMPKDPAPGRSDLTAARREAAPALHQPLPAGGDDDGAVRALPRHRGLGGGARLALPPHWGGGTWGSRSRATSAARARRRRFPALGSRPPRHSRESGNPGKAGMAGGGAGGARGRPCERPFRRSARSNRAARVVHRQQVVDVRRDGLHPHRQRLVVLVARQRVQPDEPVAAALQARHPRAPAVPARPGPSRPTR